jgi:predicted alpha/beta superfamily hydrolase
MTNTRDVALSGIDIAYLSSRFVGDEFKILVTSPAPGDGPVESVLLVTDPIIQYCTAVEIVRMLRLAQYVPNVLVVGVGYRADRYTETSERRRRDLTPTISAKRGGVGGGAESFWRFIEEELKPYLQRTFAIDTGDYSFFGNSFGGLFGTWVLLSHPDTFRRYGIGSPAYWWDDYAILSIEDAYAASHRDLAASVFVSVGGFENPAGDLHAITWLPACKRQEALEDARKDQTDMEADAWHLAERLIERNYPSLKIEYQSFPGEFHATAWPLNLSRSLRYLYDAPR